MIKESKRFILETIQLHRGKLGSLACVAAGHTLVTLWIPALTQRLIDSVTPQESDPAQLVRNGVSMGLILLGRELISYWHERMKMVIESAIGEKLRQRVTKGIVRSGPRSPAAQSPADLAGRVVHECGAISQFAVHGTNILVSMSVGTLGSLSLLGSMNSWLVGFALVPIPVLLRFAFGSALANQEAQNSLLNHGGIVASQVNDLVERWETMHIHRAQGREAARLFLSFRTLRNLQVNALGRLLRQRLAFGLSAQIGTLLACGAGSVLIARGTMTMGELAACVVTLAALYQPILDLPVLLECHQKALAAALRIHAIIHLRSPHFDGQRPRLKQKQRIQRVAFTPLTGSRRACFPTLDIRRGEILWLRGASGAGKTTLTRMLAGTVPLEHAEIQVDGLQVNKECPLSALGKVVRVGPDDPLIPGSVIDNIRYGRPDATEDQVVEAAKAAQAHVVVLGMDATYHCQIGPGRRPLSSGERQRILLARAFLSAPEVLILDEATSHLDPESEDRVLDWLRETKGERCAVLVNHRLRLHGIVDREVVLSPSLPAEDSSVSELAQLTPLTQKRDAFDRHC